VTTAERQNTAGVINTVSNQNDNDDFMGGGESLSFPTIGTEHKGRVLRITSAEDRLPDGTVRTWPDGQTKKVYKWLLDGVASTETGQATLWVRGNMVKVLRDAAAKAGAKSSADIIGAQVSVKHHAVGEPTTKGYQGAKLFQAAVKLASPEERARLTQSGDMMDVAPSATVADMNLDEYDPFGPDA
jgi:hypothetical protein